MRGRVVPRRFKDVELRLEFMVVMQYQWVFNAGRSGLVDNPHST